MDDLGSRSPRSLTDIPVGRARNNLIVRREPSLHLATASGNARGVLGLVAIWVTFVTALAFCLVVCRSFVVSRLHVGTRSTWRKCSMMYGTLPCEKPGGRRYVDCLWFVAGRQGRCAAIFRAASLCLVDQHADVKASGDVRAPQLSRSSHHSSPNSSTVKGTARQDKSSWKL